jgi:membrane associated rhomboid family serine protease
MMVLWVFGNSIEEVLGGRYLFLYFYCGIAAALSQAFSNPASHVPMVGQVVP